MRTFLLVVVVTAMTSVSGDAVERPFGSGTGVLDWSVGANWANGLTPDEQGGGGDHGLLGDATADRTVTVSDTTGGANGPDARLNWKQTTAGVVNKIQLLSDWQPSSCCTSEGYFTNDTGDSNAMVMDLNGNEWRTFGGGTLILPAMTIQGPGVWEQDRKLDFGTGTTVGAGVTVKNNFGGMNIRPGSVWSPDSTLAVHTDNIYSGVGATLGNVNVNHSWGYNGSYTVQDLTIGVGETNNVWFHGGITAQLSVQGDFTDPNPTGAYSPAGRFLFNGNSSVQEVSVQRPLTQTIRIADGASVQLNHDLDASGNTATNPHESLLSGGSSLDLNGNDFSSNRLVMIGPSITWGVGGAEQSVINIGADGAHFIGSTDVTIKNLGGWAGGDLTLFNIDENATIQGSFSLGTLTLPGIWTSDGIAIEGQNVVLKNLVPEPTSLALLLLGSLLAVSRRRR
ncbi:MAG: PEP-CTERM sorting domain-containing protein [Pirellulaceae bacterium]|nr:PEP-CTERM sorting domain-containing protein [Pirellulaceae bacterium]